jgi:hypothetical protein
MRHENERLGHIKNFKEITKIFVQPIIFDIGKFKKYKKHLCNRAQNVKHKSNAKVIIAFILDIYDREAVI